MVEKSTFTLRVAIALAAFAGLRQGEVRALEVRDVDLKTGVITVRHALSENETVALKSGTSGWFLSGLAWARSSPGRGTGRHSKLHTTQRYVHATGTDLRDAIGRLSG